MIKNMYLLRSTKNAFIMQSKSTFLDYVFMDTNLAPRKIIQGRKTSLSSTMCIGSSGSRVSRFASRVGALA